MGNLRGWPPFIRKDTTNRRQMSLTQHWFKEQLALTYQIISRCIELGIDVILPGFSGHVPSALQKYIKNAQFYDGSKWFGMPSQYTNVKFMDPTDDFYVELGLQYQQIQFDMLSSFLQTKHNQKGTHSVFLWLDQFNELTPKSSDLAYLQKSGRNQLKSLQLKQYYESASNESVVKIKWTVQGRFFFKVTLLVNNVDLHRRNVLTLNLRLDVCSYATVLG